MLDFICNGSVDLFGSGRDRRTQNENICLQRDSNQHHASPRQESQRLRPLGHEGLIMINGLMSYKLIKPLRDNTFLTSGAARSKTLTFLAWYEFESRWKHIFAFWIFAPSPFRTYQRSPSKWNQAWPFTCSHSCFRPQIRLIIQGFVYL